MAVWIVIGLISLLVVLSLFALVLVAVLQRIGHDVSELLEIEPWAIAPPIGAKSVARDRPIAKAEQRRRAQEPSWRSSAVRPDRSHRNA